MCHRLSPFHLLTLGFFLCAAIQMQGATFTVTQTSSSGPGSLFQAFLDAEGTPEADTILFDEAVDGQTIHLSQTIVINSGTVTLNGGTVSKGVTLSGSNSLTIFRVESGAVLNLFQVNLTEGRDVAGPGAVLVIGEANLTRCAVFNNEGSSAGGIFNSGVLNLTNCTVANNRSSTGVGGISSISDLSLTHCTISGNSTSESGGGVNVGFGTAIIRQCIIAGNLASVSGADVRLSTGTLTWAGQNIVQAFHHSAGTQNGPSPINAAPLLAALGDYGGQTLSMPPRPGSPAIDPVDGATTSTLGSDQRGYARVIDAGAQDGAVVDIGAVETVTVVTTTLDAVFTSLRGILKASAPGHTITFAPSLAGATLALNGSQIVLTRDVILDGTALTLPVTVNGNQFSRLFRIPEGVTVEMRGINLTHGNGRGDDEDGSGGAILNKGSLTLKECTLTGNRAQRDGNSRGGAIFSRFGTLIMESCTLSGNISTSSGGAVYSRTDLSGLVSRFVQCTVVGNTATSSGGGIFNFDGRTEIIRCTITGNMGVLDQGGGVASYGDNATETLCLGSIIAENSPSDVEFVTQSVNNSFTSQGHNFVGNGGALGDFNQSGDQTGDSDAMLGALGDYGGRTLTRLPLPGSPVIDAGGTTTLTLDQRGSPRVVDGDAVTGAVVDIGAAEGVTLAESAPGAIAFIQVEEVVSEALGTQSVQVTRMGGTFGRVSALVNSMTGTASAADFNAVVNHEVVFEHGQSLAEVPVTIVSDPNLKEAHETFTLTLSAPSGGAVLGTPAATTVRIIDFFDTGLPTVSITAPKANAVFPESGGNAAMLTGTAKDDKGLGSVLVKLNNGPSEAAAIVFSADRKTATWSRQLLLTRGLNVVETQAVDLKGNISKIVSRSFIYKVARQLAVTVAGPADSGTVVRGFAPSSDRDVGMPVKITASPKAGFMFAGWTANDFTGTGVTDAAKELPVLTFLMQEGLELTANFIANPFVPEIVGVFDGLALRDAGSGVPDGNAHTGILNSTITSKGGFTAKLRLEGSLLSFSGVFHLDGTSRFGKERSSSITLKRRGKPDLTLTLALDMNPANARLDGSFTQTLPAGVVQSSIEAYRAHFSAKNKVPEEYAGKSSQRYNFVTYSLSFFNSLPPAKYPQGTGIGFMNVSTSGKVAYVGKLADNTVYSGAAALSAGRTLPLFAQLYKGAGCLASLVTLDTALNDMDLVGERRVWFRPPLSTSQWYPDGWAEGIHFFLAGAKYRVPAKTENMSVIAGLGSVDADGNALVSFDGGHPAVSVSKAVNISSDNKVTKVDVADKSFSLKLTAATGEVSGDFTDTNGKKIKYTGITLQKGGAAGTFGYFMSAAPRPLDFLGESGYFSIFPK